jgi:hypothetical protein
MRKLEWENREAPRRIQVRVVKDGEGTATVFWQMETSIFSLNHFSNCSVETKQGFLKTWKQHEILHKII